MTIAAGGSNKVFQHVENVFVQDNQVRTDQKKPPFLVIKKEVCFDQYELDYHGRIKFLQVEMPYRSQRQKNKVTTAAESSEN